MIRYYFYGMASIAEEIQSRFKNEHQKFIVNLLYTANWFKNAHIDFLKPFGISPQQFNILRILRGASDWVTMSLVKERMIEKAPNATRLADKLLEKGLIERKRCDSDRRVVYVQISSKGLELLEQIDAAQEHPFSEELKSIPESEMLQGNNLLDKMRDLVK